MIGVFCQLVGPWALGKRVFSSSGTADWRQAMCRFLMELLSIWSSEEYFVLALSPEYAGHSRLLSAADPAAVHTPTAAATASTRTRICRRMQSPLEGC